MGSLAGALLFLAAAAAAPAGAPALALPIDCNLGESCWLANYPDRAAGPEALDYTCGPRSYNGHKGTDFALRDLASLAENVAVLAAADGTVLRVRDGEPEGVSEAHRADAREQGRECGNGMVIDHGGGWTTQYCHLKKGSVRVLPGQAVAQGETIGAVGVSGNTEFPHLHVQLAYKGQPFDPFTGTALSQGCGNDASGTVWQDPPPYGRGLIYNVGVADEAPAWAAVGAGDFRSLTLACSAPALVLWMEVYGAQSGDSYAMQLRDPDGKLIYERADEFERTQARAFRFGGKRLKTRCWAAGVYRAEFSVYGPEKEDGERLVLSREEALISLTPL